MQKPLGFDHPVQALKDLSLPVIRSRPFQFFKFFFLGIFEKGPEFFFIHGKSWVEMLGISDLIAMVGVKRGAGFRDFGRIRACGFELT